MSASTRHDRPTPSAVWLWGFWLYITPAVGAFVVSLYAPSPLDRVLRVIAGVLLIFAGVHQESVVNYKRATRGPYSTFGPYSYFYQRQAGWSAAVLGVVFILSAVIGF